MPGDNICLCKQLWPSINIIDMAISVYGFANLRKRRAEKAEVAKIEMRNGFRASAAGWSME
jgi:hypothetical protein